MLVVAFVFVLATLPVPGRALSKNEAECNDTVSSFQMELLENKDPDRIRPPLLTFVLRL